MPGRGTHLVFARNPLGRDPAREQLPRDPAHRATTAPGFLRGRMGDPERALARHVYHLTADALRLFQDLRR